MRKFLILTVIPLLIGCHSSQSLPKGFSYAERKVSAYKGKIVSLSVDSKQMGHPLQVDIWLPPTYNTSSKPFPVLYMHDGQNIFDNNITWNHQSWNVDSVLVTLSDSIPIPVVVGIYCEESRFKDYLPANYIEALKTRLKTINNYFSDKLERDDAYNHYIDSVVKPFLRNSEDPDDISCNSQQYIDFIVNTLKPFIDSAYNVCSDRDHTYIMGSSMGALVSVYAIQYRPDVFGTAMGLSYPAWTEFWEIQKGTWDTYAKQPNVSQIYIDNGTGMLDSSFFPQFLEIEPIMRQNGWDKEHFTVRIFPNADHTENAWMDRLHIPILWAFSK